MFELLHTSPGWALGRWRCAGSDAHVVEEVVGWHEVVVPLRGAFVRERRGVEVLGSPNVALLADRGDRYRIHHPVPGGDECAVFLLSDGAMEDLGRATGAVAGTSEPRFRADRLPVSPDAFLGIAGILHGRTRLPPLGLESRVASLLHALLARPGAPAPSAAGSATRRRHRRAVLRATEFIAARYRSPITLEEIARAALYSPFHLSRIFRSLTGVSPYRYVTRLRLRRAATDILEGEDDLGGLALRVGFASHSHMTEAFRREYGAPPSAIRARSR